MVESLKIRPEQLGVLESIRELPGFILVFIAALTMRIAEPLLAGGALLIEGFGIASVYFATSVEMLILISFTWSLGLHTWMPLNQSIALATAEEDRRGRRLGQMRSMTAFSNLVGMALVAGLAPLVGLRAVFLIAGAAIVVAAICVLRIPRDLRQVEKPRLVFRRRYLLYYTLTFLEGCRKQVFITFAVFALVQVYGSSVSQIALLMVGVNLANIVLAPRIGRLIDRHGERLILSANYLALVFIFLGYGVVTSRTALFALYAADGVIFTLSLALTTYLDKIAEPRDVMPTLSMGVTANHFAAILVPITGGLLWASYGYQVFFFAGAAIALVSLAVSQLVPARVEQKVLVAVES
jgi:predicted MFS family arabinose efflux permease